MAWLECQKRKGLWRLVHSFLHAMTWHPEGTLASQWVREWVTYRCATLKILPFHRYVSDHKVRIAYCLLPSLPFYSNIFFIYFILVHLLLQSWLFTNSKKNKKIFLCTRCGVRDQGACRPVVDVKLGVVDAPVLQHVEPPVVQPVNFNLYKEETVEKYVCWFLKA